MESSYRNKDEYKFKLSWYPPQWLVWYCYGPPAGLDTPELGKRQMDHLIQVTSVPQGLTLEQEVSEIGKLGKQARRASQAKTNKNKEEVGEESEGSVRVIKHIREDVRPVLTKADYLERAIEGKHMQMQLAMSMGFTEERVNVIRMEYFALVQRKIDMAMNDFENTDA